jgi:hypothetical protein
MKHHFLFLLLGLLSPGFAQSVKPIFPQPLSPRLANYRIDVTLDPVTKKLNGRETLTWHNPSTDVVRELRFHLYLNAFRNDNSTFMRESSGQLRGMQIDRNANYAYGSIYIWSMKRRGAVSETLVYQYIQPDDSAAGGSNPSDHTVIRVPLDKPVGPGETIVLDIDFRAKLPKIFARTGFSRDFFLVGQWFPKIGVYEPAGTRYATTGQWNCHQFHADSEFYADYGVYDVTITTPKDYWVSATGLFQSEKLHKNGTKTILYHAEDVVDFAWTASPHFKVINDSWKRPSGGQVSIEAVMQPEHQGQAQRHIDAAKVALAYFDKHLGRYPFPNLTIVDPPLHASGAFGMEYPTFITAGTTWAIPSGARFPEVVTTHEFGHQYFMQLLASNEFEEAWLDEGFNQYYEGRIMDETYGPHASQVDLLGFRLGDLENARSSYAHQSNPALGSSFGNTWQLTPGQYGVLTYFKTATWLRTLEGLVGRPLMDEIMQTYFTRWKFKHPDGKNFIDIVNELVPKRLGNKYGPSMNWFFDQVLYGDNVVDYQLQSLRNRTANGQKQTVVTVQRKRDGYMPVDILVHFDNGKETTLHWDSKDRQRQFTLTQNAKAVWATVDPKQKIYMDIDFNNNSLTLQPSSAPTAKYATKFLFWVQNWMQWLAWLA